ncbi:MAG: 5'/3'-nucleotidase SurE [Planctomycetes bacterium]|nr:5'/3'-nucleotidase SurE [Planctomycetota bacterium]
MPTFLLTNDDGIDAPGMQALYQAAEGLGERVVIAPREPQSGSGHAVTTKGPITVSSLHGDWYAVAGTPADCSRVGLTRIARGADWVLAGINRGGNLGVDTYTSGTVAAAREAAFLGHRAMALSQYIRPDLEIDWSWTLRQAQRAIRLLLARPLRPGAFWNVNLPHLEPGAADPRTVFCGLDLCPLDVRFEAAPGPDGASVRYAGNYHGRARNQGRDVEVCFAGSIAVTEIPLDITGD